MNEFEIYKHLCDMSDIAIQYEDGKELADTIAATALRLSSKLYRVAVIGEFKRGKSSLINALVGSSILPTDILPMTAVNTHLVYGAEKKIEIYFKDGTVQDSSVEQLMDYATKYDQQREKMARTVERIVVHYPSVYCKNHIEIIDTPGMNDNDEMTSVTLSVLGQIDAAIMVISAAMPLSESEQDLVLSMIEQQGIHHVVFVVTHIDKVSKRVSEQNRIIGFIRQRISDDLLKRALSIYIGDAVMAEKARDILTDPFIFGVSSVLAMQGFTSDDNETLNASRFPRLKQELLEILTAAQSTDSMLNMADYCRIIQDNLSDWHEQTIKSLKHEINRCALTAQKSSNFLHNAKDTLIQSFIALDKTLVKESSLYGDSDKWIKDTVANGSVLFKTALADVRKDTDTDELILQILNKYCDIEWESLCENSPEDLPTFLINHVDKNYEAFTLLLPDRKEADRMYGEWKESAPALIHPMQQHGFIPQKPKSVEPIEVLTDGYHRDSVAYVQAAQKYLSSYRALMFRIHAAAIQICDPDAPKTQMHAAEKRLAAVENGIDRNRRTINRIADALAADNK